MCVCVHTYDGVHIHVKLLCVVKVGIYTTSVQHYLCDTFVYQLEILRSKQSKENKEVIIMVVVEEEEEEEEGRGSN